jgi:hypothetical protein
MDQIGFEAQLNAFDLSTQSKIGFSPLSNPIQKHHFDGNTFLPKALDLLLNKGT